ncbi:nitrilase-related carbon-nitrogen hydrolase [Gordonia soli]|uniref:Putative hydrolase n=1 Tax=Gordonia soli NBRC 108243 TaxID=1223545 RepID=M0QH87_9ACTN|nr:nitrilase-related carbon-nitrogen hydrolase [Gordonia soli]GAC67995.1 putative hydrolase [Gordonia soli NBRC 108243]
MFVATSDLSAAPPLSRYPADRHAAPGRAPVRVGLVQHRWQPDLEAVVTELAEGIRIAAEAGARAVFLPEITLLQYPAFTRGGPDAAADAEDLDSGPTVTFARRIATLHGIFVHASVYERATEIDDGLGFNTAVLISPDGELIGRTRKLHIPVTSGYYEDTYFRPGPSDDPHPVYRPDGLGAAVGLPTCWDEWFPELARSYSLAGADIIAYPTAIGSEPDFPDFDTEPLWQQVIVGNAITAGTFMVVPNRWGDEGEITFYGSSFICDPYGRILVQAPRDESAVLVADLDLDQRRDWLTLFPFLRTRRPDTYAALVEPVADTALGESEPRTR